MAIKDNYKCTLRGRTTYVVVGGMSKEPPKCQCGGDLKPC